MRKRKIGKIIKPGDVNIWAHEEAIAKTYLKKAKWQSERVIIDSRRMKGVPDDAILRELRASIGKVPEIKRLKYISKHGELIDII